MRERHLYKNPGTASVQTDAVPGFPEIQELQVFVQMPFLHFCQISAFLPGATRTGLGTSRFGYELTGIREERRLPFLHSRGGLVPRPPLKTKTRYSKTKAKTKTTTTKTKTKTKARHTKTKTKTKTSKKWS
jgi:hypothetical protein